MTLTVFTSVLGNTDALKKPTRVNASVRYVCFTDQPLRIPPYETVWMEGVTDPKLTSRELKILANHPALGDPDATLWHDAAFRLDCDPLSIASKLLHDSNMVALRHPHRNTIEEEAEAIELFGWIPKATMLAQIATYRAAGFAQTHITSTGLCFRRRTPQLKAFNELWWAEVQRWGWRDQMSVDYALWKSGVTPTYIPGHYRDNVYAKWFLSGGRAAVRLRRPLTAPRARLRPALKPRGVA